ncbi:RILP-like protein 1 [Glandiceps talaboti]
MAECTVVEVYEIAASIGKELEKLIDTYGGDAVSELMPKIIISLEKLEAVTKKNENHNTDVDELVVKFETVQKEVLLNQEERVRLTKEVQDNEEKWRDEAKELLQMISSLQAENDDLKHKVSAQAGAVTNEMAKAQEDHKVMYKLKEAVDRQRDEIRAKDRELKQKTLDIEALQSQIERLARINHDLRRKQTLVQNQATNLIDQKVELEARIQTLQQEIDQQDIEDGALQMSIEVAATNEQFDPPINLDGKMIIDMKDPNRPRFTKEELKMVLKERIELKTLVFQLEEELSHYKPEESDDIHVDGSDEKNGKLEEKKKEEKPVQSESGIRKLFKFFSRKNEKKSKQTETSKSSENKDKKDEKEEIAVSSPDSVSSGVIVVCDTPPELETSVEELESQCDINNGNVERTQSEMSTTKQEQMSGGATSVFYTSDDYLPSVQEEDDTFESSGDMESPTSSGDWRKNRPKDFNKGSRSSII